MNFIEVGSSYLLEVLAYAAITAIGICGAYLSTKATQGKRLDNIAAAITQVT